MSWQDRYDNVLTARDSVHIVELNGKVGFVKEDGTEIFLPIADDVFDFKCNKGSVTIGKVKFFIHKNRKILGNKHKIIIGCFR